MQHANIYKALFTCSNFQALKYQEFLEEVASRKAFADANFTANQMYHVEIGKSKLQQITIPDLALCWQM